MIDIKNLHVHFRSSEGPVHAVRGVNIKVERGQFYTMLGHSGCGKTTTLRCLAGLERPSSAEISIDGQVVFSSERNLMIPPYRRDIGMVFQSYAIWPHMDVFENVAFPLREHTDMSEDEIARAVREKLELVNLPNTEHLMPVDLSGGMRKRVGLARSIVLDPKMILYDEPTTGLDPITAQKINELIIDLQSKLNVTSVVVTHDIQSAFSVGDRIAFLNRGVFEWVGTADAARDADHPMLREFFRASAVTAAQPSKAQD